MLTEAIARRAGAADSAFVNPVRGKSAAADNGLFTVRAAFSA
jgi:hypothetical protein